MNITFAVDATIFQSLISPSFCEQYIYIYIYNKWMHYPDILKRKQVKSSTIGFHLMFYIMSKVGLKMYQDIKEFVNAAV